MAKVFFDEQRLECRVGKHTVLLNRLNFKLLYVLYQHKNKVVLEQQLIDALLPEDHIGPDHIRQRIKHLQSALKAAGVWQFAISAMGQGKYGLRVKTNPVFVLWIAVFGFILFMGVLKYVVSPLVENVTMVNNRVVMWQTTEVFAPYDQYQAITRSFQDKLYASDIILYVAGNRDLSMDLNTQARAMRAGLVILWHGEQELGKHLLTIQVIEPKSLAILHEKQLNVATTPVSIYLDDLINRLEQVMLSPQLPITPAAIADENHPDWIALRAIFNN